TKVHGGNDGRMRATPVGWRTSGDALDPGNPCGDDRHVRGGNHRIAPPGHIAADGIDRNVLVAENHARQRLDLEISPGVALALGKAAHLRLRKSDVIEIALGNLADGAFDLLLRKAEGRRGPIVEFSRELPYGLIAPQRDVGED